MLSPAFCFLILLAFWRFLCVKAELFVVNPQQGSACHGGEPCTVTWLDNGVHPLLSEIGVCTVGLYTGKQELVQTVTPVDVSQQLSLTFTPISAAGPNSDAYYLSFISASAKQNNSLPYAAFSSFFRLDRMTGSFTAPDPSAILSIPIPTSIITRNSSNGNTVLSTITVGTILPSTTHSSSVSFSATTAGSSQTTVTPSTAPHTQLSSPSTASSTTDRPPAPINSLSLVSSATTSGSTLTVPPSSSLSTVSVSTTPSSPTTSPSTGSTSGALSAGLSAGTGISIAVFAGVVAFFLTP